LTPYNQVTGASGGPQGLQIRSQARYSALRAGEEEVFLPPAALRGLSEGPAGLQIRSQARYSALRAVAA